MSDQPAFPCEMIARSTLTTFRSMTGFIALLCICAVLPAAFAAAHASTHCHWTRLQARATIALQQNLQCKYSVPPALYLQRTTLPQSFSDTDSSAPLQWQPCARCRTRQRNQLLHPSHASQPRSPPGAVACVCAPPRRRARARITSSCTCLAAASRPSTRRRVRPCQGGRSDRACPGGCPAHCCAARDAGRGRGSTTRTAEAPLHHPPATPPPFAFPLRPQAAPAFTIPRRTPASLCPPAADRAPAPRAAPSSSKVRRAVLFQPRAAAAILLPLCHAPPPTHLTLFAGPAGPSRPRAGKVSSSGPSCVPPGLARQGYITLCTSRPVTDVVIETHQASACVF